MCGCSCCSDDSAGTCTTDYESENSCCTRTPPSSEMVCKHCGSQGIPVDRITVIVHTKEEHWHEVGDDMYFCPSPECDVVYFNDEVCLLKEHVKSRVTLKEREHPIPLCYCKGVTLKDVENAVRNGANTLEDVRRATGLATGRECRIANPMGRCCLTAYPSLVKEVLNRHKEAQNL
ncbi:MAG TPA: (2Fe-2S)-binding protein [Methermicoccus shengliensis]|uniref:(2Fe-2S)-binding protein n=2 Tax=Methermicoccus shengliensis TaxID=660064 RepID=A0A832RXR2_9EURY|nr:(2Fe-2S)-binding protein [Methermicoccus shengliensis]KUK04097.1 MAG: BFD domain protein (2Fe-2S)-binding domain protein [Euryarchaeota archaeon 55_53]KUK29845.1 MAG: BFD domain protein (2Fe-2S)-binding domain protein [Methanosarcinales archeaon 56_1174]MDI3488488.1 hypothetical protein [Methanosarcinales archaeon]HIH69809.1 (2Fe-2S)-binding protein [Methermicoccus shengliensis]